MIKKVRDYIRQFNMIECGDEIVAGVSGGADSVCMLLQLAEYRKECDFELKVVHINHLIRDDASQDALFVENMCERLNVPYYLFEEDVEKQAKELGLSTEEAGRRIRYIRFDQVKCSDKAKVAVAHNRNDVAETVLFNMFRGTGVEGLASLLPINGNIIRPLLGVNRNEIEEYLGSIGQTYRTDSTNEGTDYARNKIRNVILPYAEKEIVSEATNHIAGLSDKMILVREYIKRETRQAYDSVVECVNNSERCINITNFNLLDELLRSEVILLALEELTAGRKDIGQVHVNSILELTGKTGEKRIDLPYGLEAVKQYDRLIIRKFIKQEQAEMEYELIPEGNLLVGESKILTKLVDYSKGMVIPQNAYTKWFDYDKIIECLVVRNRRQGDYLTVNDKFQKKLLKDYFIDIKIPKEQRGNQILIADGSHIMWVVGGRISEYYKVTDETKKVLEIKIEQLEDN